MNSRKSFAGLLGWTARISGLNATMAMARRSSAENPLLRVAVSFTASDVVVTRTLFPSGAAALTDFAARLPPAPALAFEDVGYCFQHFLPKLGALDVLMPECNAEAQDR